MNNRIEVEEKWRLQEWHKRKIKKRDKENKKEKEDWRSQRIIEETKRNIKKKERDGREKGRDWSKIEKGL